MVLQRESLLLHLSDAGRSLHARIFDEAKLPHMKLVRATDYIDPPTKPVRVKPAPPRFPVRVRPDTKEKLVPVTLAARVEMKRQQAERDLEKARKRPDEKRATG